MNLLIVNYLSVIGGVERVLERFAAQLQGSGHELIYAVTQGNRAEAHVEEMRRCGAKIVYFPDFTYMVVSHGPRPVSDEPIQFYSRKLRLRTRVRRWLTARILPGSIKPLIWHWRLTRRAIEEFTTMVESNPELRKADAVLLCAGIYTWLAGAVAAFHKMGFKRVGIRLGNPPEYAPPTRIDRYWLSKANPFFFVSRDTMTQWERAMNCRLTYGRVLPTPIPVPAEPMPLNWPRAGEIVRLVCLSRLTTKKGVDVAIQAVHRLIKQGYRVTLDLAGLGVERANLEKSTRELGVTDVIKFHGHLDDVNDLMRQSHILLIPSRVNEGLPNTLLQGMAMGIPVIGTDVGGTRELTGNNERGLLIPPEDVEALVQAIVTLIEEPATKGLLVSCAHAYMKKYHDVPKSLKILLDGFDCTSK